MILKHNVFVLSYFVFSTWGQPVASADVAVWKHKARRIPERWGNVWAGSPAARRCEDRAPRGP